MMNNFYEKQNEPHMPMLLAAQRQAYSDIKRTLLRSFVAGVVIPSALSLIFFVMSFYPGYIAPWVKAVLTTYGLGFFILNHFAMEHISSCKKRAARIQEEYDTCLYDMEWNIVVAGKKTPYSECIEYAQKHLDIKGDRLIRNWHLNSPLNVPAPLMTLLCQSKNLSWDARLKRKNSTLLSVILAVNIMMFAVTFMFANPSFLAFIAFAAIILPTYQFYYRYVSDNKKSVLNADELRSLIENTLRQAVDTHEYDRRKIEKLSRIIQGQIFSYRASGNPAPDFIHTRNRNKYEECYDRIFQEYSIQLEKSVNTHPDEKVRNSIS